MLLVISRGRTSPAGVSLSHKLNQNVIELCFDNQTKEALLAAEPDWPKRLMPDQKSEQAVLSINVPLVDPHRVFLQQVDPVEAALKVAYCLLPYGQILEGVGQDPRGEKLCHLSTVQCRHFQPSTGLNCQVSDRNGGLPDP